MSPTITKIYPRPSFVLGSICESVVVQNTSKRQAKCNGYVWQIWSPRDTILRRIYRILKKTKAQILWTDDHCLPSIKLTSTFRLAKWLARWHENAARHAWDSLGFLGPIQPVRVWLKFCQTCQCRSAALREVGVRVTSLTECSNVLEVWSRTFPLIGSRYLTKIHGRVSLIFKWSIFCRNSWEIY
jgi:hypothetical protein